MAVQLLANNPVVPPRTTKFSVHAMADNNPPARRCSRLSVQALAQNLGGAARCSRLAVQIFGQQEQAARCGRLAVQVLGPTPQRRVVPLPLELPTPDYDIADWSEGTTTSTLWNTNIEESPVTGAEQRRQLYSRPQHVVRADFLGVRQDRSTRLYQSMARRTENRFPFPIVSDKSLVLQDVPNNGTTIICDTRYRRFFAGARVMLFSPRSHDRFPLEPRPDLDVVYATIAIVFPDTLILESGIKTEIGPFEAGKSWAIPVIDSEINLDEQGILHTDHHRQLSVEAREVMGLNTLPRLPLINGIGFSTHEGRPVLPNRFANWITLPESGYGKSGDTLESGRTVLVSPFGDQPRATATMDATRLSRKEVWEVASFFDLCRGRTRSFFTPSPQRDWIIIFGEHAANEDAINVLRVGHVETFRNLVEGKYIVMVLKPELGGLVFIYKVQSVKESISLFAVFELKLDRQIGFSTSLVDYVAVCHLCRWDSDRLDEHWITDEACRISLPIRELIDEGSKSIPNL